MQEVPEAELHSGVCLEQNKLTRMDRHIRSRMTDYMYPAVAKDARRDIKARKNCDAQSQAMLEGSCGPCFSSCQMQKVQKCYTEPLTTQMCLYFAPTITLCSAMCQKTDSAADCERAP